MNNLDELRAILQLEGVISCLRGMLGGTNSDAAAFAIGELSKDGEHNALAAVDQFSN
ncbi:hypothetical protein FIBSPDRAFT_863913 [Athelia psychrophila]|uniref:Uncharacterized protein n=1 Tax=Athelia psychrophila TaxID=1759441 RepID=A0A166GVS5_9AGAM|nr:hypothetical protein FIBSPDRAFT_863913 [Fibularhizoctonia sp. CBS 109695]